ncbi:MAG: endonuclease/exonuclease/phosphatase, partial [Acidimicrobiaceae bacterium]
MATPPLDDPNFDRTVVYMLEHHDLGAVGVVLNRPGAAIDELGSRLGVRSDSDSDSDAAADAGAGDLDSWLAIVSPPSTIFLGGPVGDDSLIAVASGRGRDDAGWGTVTDSLGAVDLSWPPDEVAEHIDALRVFQGYSGWGPGQLEDEIAAGGWMTMCSRQLPPPCGVKSCAARVAVCVGSPTHRTTCPPTDSARPPFAKLWPEAHPLLWRQRPNRNRLLVLRGGVSRRSKQVKSRRTQGLALLVGVCSIGIPVALPTAAAFTTPSDTVFVNEIHYDNAGTDAGESIEVVGPAGTDLAGWSLVLYNGSGGAAYSTTALAGVIPDQSGGWGTLAFAHPVNGIQNGSPDAIALVDAGGTLRQFLSYEGTFVGVGGIANGVAATDIGVSETGTEAVGMSLQLTGAGTSYG